MVEERHDTFKFDFTTTKDNHEERIKILEEDVAALKTRPVATGGGNVEIDYSILASKD